MKKRLMLPAVIAALLMAISFTSCSEEDDSAFESAVAAAKERNKETPATPSTPTPPPPPATFTVTFDLNGGTSSDTLEYTVNNGALLSTVCSYLPIATKEDYYFAEWRTNPDGTGASISSTSQYIYSNVKYYAVWKKLVKTMHTDTTEMSLKIGEQKSFEVTYSPADAVGVWQARTNSSSSRADYKITDKGNGVVEFTFTGRYVGSALYSVADSKSDKSYAINVTVSAPDTSSIPELPVGTTASSNPSDYTGLDKTLDSTTPMLLYKLNLEANTPYIFQCASKSNSYTNLPGIEDLGYCYFSFYNSNFTGTIYLSYISGVGYEYRPSSAVTCYLAISKDSYYNTAKGGVHVYKSPSVESITLASSSIDLTVGSGYQYIDVTITPSDVYRSFSITSSPSGIVYTTFDDSYYDSTTQTYVRRYRLGIQPRTPGSTTVTITDTITGKSASCNVTVTGTNVTSLALSQTTLAISQGETKTLTVTPTPENANVSYSTGNNDYRIAKCSLSGSTVTVTGGAVPGSTTYTVYDNYTNKYASCTITNTTGITAAAVTDELLVVGNAASTSLADYTIATVNNAQPVKYYKVEVPAANSGKRYNFQTARSGNNPIIGNTFVAGECYFYLYDQDFNLLTYTSSGTIQRSLTAGTYYFAIVYSWPYETYSWSAKGGVHLYVTN